MKLNMTVEQALAFADDWSKGVTFHPDTDGWRVVYMVLAEEVRRLRADEKRIDWLADRDNHIGEVLLPIACVESHVDSLRDAIDAAMAIGEKP